MRQTVIETDLNSMVTLIESLPVLGVRRGIKERGTDLGFKKYTH